MIGHQNFPVGYNPYPYTALPQVQQQIQQQQIQQQIQPQQTQRTVLVVQSEEEVNRYPIAPGNVITFIVEGKQLVMEKSLASQFDVPKVKRYRLVEEDAPEIVNEKPDYALKSDIEHIEEEIASLKAQIPKKSTKKKEESEDE